jgi:hypothetical protein
VEPSPRLLLVELATPMVTELRADLPAQIHFSVAPAFRSRPQLYLKSPDGEYSYPTFPIAFSERNFAQLRAHGQPTIHVIVILEFGN